MIEKVTEDSKKLSFQEFKNEVLTDYRTAIVSRECSLLGRREVLTGKAKFDAVYQRLLSQYRVRELKAFKTEKDFDDAQHVFCHLDNLFRIEKDPELLAAYRVVMEALWQNHQNDASF